VIAKKKASFCLARVSPFEGYTHQIRTHLAFIRHPIIGDKLYDYQRFLNKENSIICPYTANRLFLHAEIIEFEGSVYGRKQFRTTIPNNFFTFSISKSNY